MQSVPSARKLSIEMRLRVLSEMKLWPGSKISRWMWESPTTQKWSAANAAQWCKSSQANPTTSKRTKWVFKFRKRQLSTWPNSESDAAIALKFSVLCANEPPTTLVKHAKKPRRMNRHANAASATKSSKVVMQVASSLRLKTYAKNQIVSLRWMAAAVKSILVAIHAVALKMKCSVCLV